ncbi:MAG: AMP-binding protein [Ilumatobacteraceae bacterium]|nr:AMP-binding protein [Ilumatobacteraceae bacterium]
MRASTSTATLSGILLAGAGSPHRPALVSGDRHVTFSELAALVDARRADVALPARSIVTLTGDHSIEFVVTYLALIESGHVPLLAGSHGDRLSEAWPVGAVVVATDEVVEITQCETAQVELHPDLAILVSTSGSTGSPKLARLSHRNLLSNAESIADYLRLTPDDRGITSLPLHYCYGLSVLHSHLLVGASVVLTDTSVVDPCFRTALFEHGVTNLAGVPHTYEMLDRASPDELAASSLRLLTQAGGRMAPEAVTRWAERVAGWGAEFVVMYGQTEATARIAYLPPELTLRRPSAIGRPIPGGSLELRPVDGQPGDVGELVYRGANVMMGYAGELDDLALGHTLDELATGDLARYHAEDDVYEIVGRRSRFVKPFGLRIDLDEVESQLAPHTAGALAVAGDDDRVVVFAPGSDPAEVAERLSAVTGLPGHCCRVHDRPIPRTASDKVDQATMLATDAGIDVAAADEQPSTSTGSDGSVAAIFAAVLGVARVDDTDTFVSLGGDSLSYVECSIRLEATLGQLPSDWHLQPISTLAAAAVPRRRWARLDTTVALRAIGICLVVATHMRVRHVPGGAHTLLAVAGYNLARFMAPLPSPGERIRAGLRTAGRAAVPTMVWVAVGMTVFGSYSVGTLLLVNNYVGPSSHADDHWHFWFIEVFVHLVLLASLLTIVPAVRRMDRRFAYLVPLAALGLALVFRMEWAYMGEWYNLRFRTHGVAWFFALGWLIQRSTTWWQRSLTSIVALATVLGYFHTAAREWRILVLLVVLVWVRELPVPRWSVRIVGTLAAASMWIYVSHFTIWPLYRLVFIREVSYVLTIVSGVLVWFVAERSLGSLNNWRQAWSWRRATPEPVARVASTTPRLQH